MVAVNPLDAHSTDYYALWEAYASGVYPTDSHVHSDKREEKYVQSPKGLDKIFEKDRIVDDWDRTYQAMTTIYSQHAGYPLAALKDPILDDLIYKQRYEAHLMTVC